MLPANENEDFVQSRDHPDERESGRTLHRFLTAGEPATTMVLISEPDPKQALRPTRPWRMRKARRSRKKRQAVSTAVTHSLNLLLRTALKLRLIDA